MVFARRVYCNRTCYQMDIMVEERIKKGLKNGSVIGSSKKSKSV
jgi:hypothetical protein